MRIDEFLSTHEDEVCEACAQNLRRALHGEPPAEMTQHMGVFLRQVVQRLRQAAGLEVETSLPSMRDTAESVAHEAQRRGLNIEDAVRSFATLSVSLGEVGARYHLAFDAAEYKAFNEAIDDSVAFAVERFARDAYAAHEHDATVRVGFLVHELRNAMSSAKMAFGALGRLHDGGARQKAAVIGRSLHRMDKLIERTLADVRLREGPPPSLRALLLSPVLNDAEADCLVERGISVAVEADGALAVMADEDLLSVVLGNLIQNGIKSSHDGATIEVRARAEGDRVVIEVEDECGGLPPGVSAALFTPFAHERGDYRGLGLGLAISRGAVLAMSGEITARDLPGKGCVFEVRIPRARVGLESVDAVRVAVPVGATRA